MGKRGHFLADNTFDRCVMDASGLWRLVRGVLLVAFLSPAVMPAQGATHRHFTDGDQALVLGWLSDAGFVVYSTSGNTPADHDWWFSTYSTLHALHASRPQRFYEYLARRVIAAPSDNGVVPLLESALDLNPTQEQVLNTMLAQHSSTELAQWLRDYINLDAHLGSNKSLSAQLFSVLTQSTLNATEHCPEVPTLAHFKSSRERRQAIFQCLARSIDQPVLDIDISVNRVMSLRLLSPQPADLPLPPPVMLDDSSNHFVMLPGFYHDTGLQPIVMLTTPTDSGFITTARTGAGHLPAMSRGLGRRVPKVRLTRHDRDEIRQTYGIPAGGEQFSQQKTGMPPWLKFWITSPVYSIFASFAIGGGIALFIAYYPYPGNPFLPPM